MYELDDDEIAAVLERNGVGVLALDGPVYPYQIPMCYGYLAADDCFVLQLTGGGEKHNSIQFNPRVSVTVFEETDPGTRWQSVVVRGVLEAISYRDEEPAFAALAANTQSAPNPVSWADSTDRGDLAPYRLSIDERAGRAFELG